ncbi:His Kinase A domain containing protein [Mortierella alpina]|uniref:histidine kinase n=1 Tax=Mortierella alpina TaxID=64518 RepID=A0A9P6M6U5_MORAP|nr:His Kinase A domain containing protein [Mortierella alpina]
MSSDPVILPFNTSPPDPALPTPNGSPTFLSSKLAAISEEDEPLKQRAGFKDSLHDEAFPSACSMIRMTLNVDAVYLVQVESNRTFIPLSGSDVVWNYMGPGSARRASAGTVADDMDGHEQKPPGLVLSCLASSQDMQGPAAQSIFDQATKQAKRDGDSWVCTDEGCRPHRLGEVLSNAVEPEWGRDLPVIKEMVGYVREEQQAPQGTSGPLYTCCQSESDWFNPSPDATNGTNKDTMRRSHLCHTFQGTLAELSAGATSPYRSCVVMPVHGAPASDMCPKDDAEPWAYFVVLSSSRTKQFTLHERIYLKNFGSCLITEVLKRRVEAADKAKGVFIKSISHELRTPLHIILGILELLNANLEGNLSEHQLAMIASAEASGKGLIDTINNIIDLADLDPDSDTESRRSDKSKGSLADLYTQVSEVDIRVLCEEVAGAMAKDSIDKNVVVLHSWAKPSSLSSRSSNTTSFAHNSISSTSTSSTAPTWLYTANRSSMEESAQGNASSSDSSSGLSASMFRAEQKASLELLVAMDEPERDPEQDAHWNFLLNVPVIKRILIQLLENALKFTTTGFVEISAVSPPLAMLPLKPPQPDARPILFTVRDTGRGISPEFVQAHLFQRFSQEDPLQAGTGLGLALVKLLVESLGGWLEIWSEGIEGKGCVVRVLIWATPCANTSKSLKDEAGPWQEKSCRFYAGESTVSTDRLWTIMGERMLGQDLNMNVQRGNEQDVSPEDMVKDLSDQSPCDLLVFNDDLARLKAYLSHWTDQQAAMVPGAEGEMTSSPTPLLMLTSTLNEKRALELVAAYRSAWEASNKQSRPATVVIMPKPIGPIKLMHYIRRCFAPQDDLCVQEPAAEVTLPSAIPILQSDLTPHINTVPLGMHNVSNNNFSAGTLIRSSFKFPATTPSGTTSGSDETTTGVISLDRAQSPQEPAPKEPCAAPKSKPQRSIRNFMAPRSGGAPRISSRKRTVSVDVAGQSSLGCCTDVNGKRVPESTDRLGEMQPVPRVLIVEDNMTNRMILRTFLRKRGVAVVEAENGKLGVERFQEEVWRRQGRCGFDFVLMDLQMPVMDGNLATKRIREFEQTMVTQHGLSTPEPGNVDKMCGMVAPADEQPGPESERRGYTRTMIFALTGLAGEEDKRLAFECGVDGYLTKPVSLKNLGALLSSCHPSMVKGDNTCPEKVEQAQS